MWICLDCSSRGIDVHGKCISCGSAAVALEDKPVEALVVREYDNTNVYINLYKWLGTPSTITSLQPRR